MGLRKSISDECSVGSLQTQMQMSHRFDVISLSMQAPIERSRVFYFRIKISESYWFKTAQQRINNNNVIPFMESNQFHIPQGIHLYYTIELIEVKHDGNYLLDKKVIFPKDIKEKIKIQLSIDQVVGVLDYDLTPSNSVERRGKKSGDISNKLKEHIQEFTQSNSDTKLEIIRMGGLYYNFVNRLDPLVKITNYLREICRWTNPVYTILFATASTLAILMPKFSIILLSLVIILSKDRLLRLGDKLSFNKSRNRLIVPKENFIFLQSNMDFYCENYEHIKDIFQNEDKTELIVIINSIISEAWLMLLLPLFLSLADILIIGLWGALLLQHPSGRQMKNVLIKIKKETTEELVRLVSSHNFQNKLITKLLCFVEMPEREIQVIKTFFLFEFQHWWFGVWTEPSEQHLLKWSDKTGRLRVLPRDKPSSGFFWTSEWLIDIDLDHTDKDGFEYSPRLINEFHKDNNLLDTIRRRRWKRTCMTKQQQESPQLKLDWIKEGNLLNSRAKVPTRRGMA